MDPPCSVINWLHFREDLQQWMYAAVPGQADAFLEKVWHQVDKTMETYVAGNSHERGEIQVEEPIFTRTEITLHMRVLQSFRFAVPKATVATVKEIYPNVTMTSILFTLIKEIMPSTPQGRLALYQKLENPATPDGKNLPWILAPQAERRIGRRQFRPWQSVKLSSWMPSPTMVWEVASQANGLSLKNTPPLALGYKWIHHVR